MTKSAIRTDDPIPIRAQLRVLLEREIHEGRFRAGARIPSERALAQRYGISRSSVRESITELISEGLLFRTVGRGTFVSSPSDRRPNEATETRNIAFIVDEKIFQFVQTGYSRILTAIDRACRERGYRLQFNTVGEGRETMFIERLSRNGVTYVDACLIVGGLQQQVLERLKQMRIPLVLVDMLINEEPTGLSTVTIDYPAGTSKATEHLYSLGHRRIGYIGFPGSEKYQSYWQTLQAVGLTYDPRIVQFLPLLNLQPGILAGYGAMQNLISARQLPSAVVVTNDLVAVGVMEALGVSGIKVPEQVSVIGFDDLVHKTSPPLSTIRVDFSAVGKVATEVALRILHQGNSDPVHVVVPVELVVRGSTAPPPQSMITEE